MQEHFSDLNAYFDKIYVLSLPRLQERIDHINKTLEGLNFDFFWGTDKNETSLEKLKASGDYNTGSYQQFYKKPTEINLGMLCCSLGHAGIYRKIIENGYKRTLILEDDVVPQNELSHFRDVITELPGDWELFYLGYEKNEQMGIGSSLKQFFYKLFPAHAQLKMSRRIYSHYYPRKVSKHIARAGFHDCTHAYAVTLEGAKKLLSYQQPVGFHPDNLLAWSVTNEKLKGYISLPKLFTQRSAFIQEIESLTGK
jgi:glycosyl transferase, family 25